MHQSENIQFSPKKLKLMVLPEIEFNNGNMMNFPYQSNAHELDNKNKNDDKEKKRKKEKEIVRVSRVSAPVMK